MSILSDFTHMFVILAHRLVEYWVQCVVCRRAQTFLFLVKL